MRTLTACCDGRKHEDGRTDMGFDRDIAGMLVEYAVARYFDLFWSPKLHQLDTYTGDLRGVHVKSITQAHHKLIVRKIDPVDFRYVLGLVGNFRDLRRGLDIKLIGWFHGNEAKQERYWEEKDETRGIHQAAYFVPQADLHPIISLIDP